MISSKQKSTVATIIVAILILGLGYSILSRDKVKISNKNWELVNGNYSISFTVQNNTKTPLDIKLSIRLRSKKYAGGSPKAEVSDIVGEKQVNIFLNPSEIKDVRQIIKPTSFAFKADTITINVWDIQ